MALLGPSGSGKTTLLNTIAALDNPTGGSYQFNGVDVPLGHVEKMTTFRRENVGYIFQFFNLLADLTALENVLLVQDLAGMRDKQKALDLLDAVGLKGLEDRFPSQMSGGQRQRVAIARALAKSPKIILGDELTGNLDSETSNMVMEALIKTCRKEKMTTIFVTHDESLTRFASRIIKLDSGRVIDDRKSDLVIKNLATTTKIMANNLISDSVKSISSKIKDVTQSILE